MRKLVAAAFLVCGVGCWVAGTAWADDVKPVTPEETKPTLRSEAQLSALIDAEVAKVWARDGITPAPQSSDHAFMRRAYLDVVGELPTVAEAEAFLADKTENRRARLIDTLLADPRFGEHMADQWLAVFSRRSEGGNRNGGDPLFGNWLIERFNSDKGLDQLFYDIITASGPVESNPATVYYSQNRELITPDVAGNATKHFTGVQIQCAQCHDHPYEEKWKVAEFNGVASFFAPLQVKKQGDAVPNVGVIVDNKRERMDEDKIAKKLAKLPEARKQEYLDKIKFNQPKFLLGEMLKTDDSTIWRSAWAKWVIGKENLQTQRYMVNRIWSFVFGVGLHNPVDDYNSFNTPSHPELLDALAKDFRDSGFGVKRLVRAMLNTRAWQLAASGATQKDGKLIESWHFASYPVRQLTPEQFFGALLTITPEGDGARRPGKGKDNPYTRMISDGEKYDQRVKDGKLTEKDKKLSYDYEALRKLEALYAEVPADWAARRRMAAGFSRATTDDEMTETDSFNLTIDQALFVMNGEMTNKMSEMDKGGFMAKILAGAKDDNSRLRALYLSVLSRLPSEAESKRVLEHAKGNDGWEDVLYALLMTTEFATNH